MERGEPGLAWEANLLEDRAYHLSETLEGLFGFPDIHDTKAVLGRTGNMGEDAATWPVTERVETRPSVRRAATCSYCSWVPPGLSCTIKIAIGSSCLGPQEARLGAQ